MKKFKTHFCMVSVQAAPNLLPLLDAQMKPDKVVLLVTLQMQRQADHLEKVIKPRGIQVVREPLEVVDDFAGMQKQLIALIEREREPAAEIALNATGGTKWMAIAAQEVFRMNGSAVFYVKVEDGKVLFLEGDRASHELTQRIDLKNYIQAYGYEFSEPNRLAELPRNLRELCESLVLNVGAWQGAIGQLNLLANLGEERSSLSLALTELPGRDPQLASLLAECENAGLLEMSGDQLQFRDETARSFANGGWLEQHVNSQLNTLRGEGVIQDGPRLNLKIRRADSGPSNEVDVCFMAKNRLHLIECKTKRMSGRHTADVATDTVYKLDSLSDLGGLATRCMLVSYRPLRPADAQRAKDLRIKVIQGTQLPQLKNSLRTWIKQ